MYRYTPIDLPALATAHVALPKRIDWNLLSLNDAVGTASSILNVAEISNPTAYEASFISCTHNEGKSWESLFIPLDADGTNGVSVTWWNRNRGLNGQVNVKLCSVSDYYNTVASKAVYKGYDVVAYVGRDRGFTRRHAFVDELARRERSSSPVIAMSRDDMDELSSGVPGWREHVGERLAKALYNHPATIQFFQRLKKKSLLGQAMREMGDVIENSRHAEIMTSFRDTLADLTAMNRTEDVAQGEVYPAQAEEKPKAAPKKTDLYQAWGAFG